MSTKLRIVRLLAAVIAALISCLFVSGYNWASLLSVERGQGLPAITDSVNQYAPWAYSIPLISGLLGIVLLRNRRRKFVLFEALIAFTWVAAFFWVLAAIFSWQLAHIEIIDSPKAIP